MTISNSIRRVILCLRTYQIALPLSQIPPLVFLLGISQAYAGSIMPILYRMWGSLLYVFLLLLIGIFLIQLIIYGFKKDRKWAWGAALIYFMYSISSGIHALYTIEDEFLIIDSFGFLIPIAVISIIIGIIGIYILIQKDVRTEFAIDTALAEFVQKSRGSRK